MAKRAYRLAVLAAAMLMADTVLSTDFSTNDAAEQAMVDKIDKFREKFVELLNETDPYERVDKMSSYANDVLTFYLSLGPMFRNGTLGTYACPKLPDWQECDIYVFPNGSTPIKKSTIGLLQRLDSSLAAAYERAKLNAATWLPEYRSNDSLDITYMHIQLSLMFRQTQSNGRFTQKRELLGLLERSTWQNNTGKKFTNRNDFMHIATYLDRHCDRYVGYAVPGGHVLEVLDSLIGSNCEHPLVYIKFEEQMRNITKRGNFNGGDSNKHARAAQSALTEMFRCLQNFVIRHNNYSEDAYKAFVGHMGTMAFNELNTYGFCLGVSTLEVRERDTKLKKFAEQFHGISKQLLDARLVLKEEPPTPETTTMTTERASSQPPASEPITFSITDQIENHRVKAIKLLNDTDAYEMATMIADSVEDTLKFYDDLGPFFRNGTVATYACIAPGPQERQWCDIYLLPNGSVPLKKSVIRLLFDVFNMSRSKYGDLPSKDVALELLHKWLPSHTGGSRNYVAVLENLVEAFYNNVIYKIWSSYNDLLSYYGLKEMPQSTWQNNTGRNLTTWDDFNEFRTFLLGTTCWQHFRGDPANDTGTSPSGVIPQVLYALMGPHCAKELDFPVEQLPTKKIIQNIQVPMKEIATCFPDFLIRYNKYDEAVYKTFVKDICTLIYHEITMVSFYLGIDAENAAKREQYRSSLPDRVRGIMKKFLDARAVLNEEPPKDLADAVKSVVSVTLGDEKSDIGSLAWKERPALYEKAIQAVVANLKVDKSTRFIGNGSLEGVLYLPYAEGDRGLHCAHSTDDISFNDTIARAANYFVKCTWDPTDIQSLKQKWEKILGDKNSVLDSVFSEKDGNLCDRVLSALSKRSQRKRRDATLDTLERTGFSAFVAVRCSYDFVWYELGWRYYTAARTTSKYVLEKNGGTFSADCGQLIFLH